MKDLELLNLIDGVFAYDTGCGSGISDSILREQLKDRLISSTEENSIYPDVLKEYVNKTLMKPEYSFEDIVEFAKWVEKFLKDDQPNSYRLQMEGLGEG